MAVLRKRTSVDQADPDYRNASTGRTATWWADICPYPQSSEIPDNPFASDGSDLFKVFTTSSILGADALMTTCNVGTNTGREHKLLDAGPHMRWYDSVWAVLFASHYFSSIFQSICYSAID